MTSLSVDDLRAGAQRIETLARGCQDVVNHLEDMHDLLEKLDLAPEMSADDGRVVLSFDWGLPGAEPFDRSERVDVVPITMVPDPEPGAGCRTKLGLGPEPEPTKDPEPETDANGIVMGPFTDEETLRIIELSVKGWTFREIATEIKRRPVNVKNKVRENWDLISASKREREKAAAKTPDDQPTPAAQPPAESNMQKVQTAPPPDLQGDDLRLFTWLENVGYPDGWTAERDYQLVESLARGDGTGGAAEKVGRTAQDCRNRWQSINRQPGDLDHQVRLLKILRMRAKQSVPA